MASALETQLKGAFGLSDFRPPQREIIETLLSGRSVLAILPTGGGKSLCYQLPALMLDGLTIVISPLISLMRDQVAGLRARGIPAASLHSGLPSDEERAIWQALESCTLRILYLSPERFLTHAVQRQLRAHPPVLAAVDEAHCMSLWGHEFRPDYLEIGPALQRYAGPIAAFTATADTRTEADIRAHLFASGEAVGFRHSVARPDLRIQFSYKHEPRAQILEIAHRYSPEKGVIFCATRRKTESLARALADEGQVVASYHAGLSRGAREQIEAAFKSGQLRLIVATVAFGMGVDVPDIRWVAHADMPASPERYLQEIGRAGRDGKGGQVHTLFGDEDIWLRRDQIETSGLPDALRWHEHGRLNAMLAVAIGGTCRAQTMAAHFAETLPACGTCDRCRNPPEQFDVNAQTKPILEALARGAIPDAALMALLDDAVSQTPFTRTQLLRGLEAFDVMRPNEAGHYAQASDVQSIRLPLDLSDLTRFRGETTRAAEDAALYARLITRRNEIAQRRGVSPWRVLHDDQLESLLAQKITSLDALARVSGIGPKRLAWFRDILLEQHTVHPARLKIAGKESATLYDALASAQQAHNAALPAGQKPLSLTRAQLARVAQRRPRTEPELAQIVGARHAAHLAPALLEVIARS